MKQRIFFYAFLMLLSSCKLPSHENTGSPHEELESVFNSYYEDRMRLFPLEATSNGDYRYNDKLPVDFTNEYRDTLKRFFSGHLAQIKKFNRQNLLENDGISYDIFKREMETSLSGFEFPDNYMPFNQFVALPLTMAQLGSGDGNQPFKSVKDYTDWQKRVSGFASWMDSAIVYFRKGAASGFVLPKILVERMIPQMRAMETNDPTTSIFYGPVKKMPASFSDGEKDKISETYRRMIVGQIVPAYKNMGNFLENEYLSKARTAAGFSALPGGDKQYNYLIQLWTTTNKTPEEIYDIGISEVTRIRNEMGKIKNETGFKQNLDSFFQFMKKDKKFMPYKSVGEVLAAFRDIQKTIDPNLHKMFGRVPKTPFEIRQTEAFRAASASAEYSQGSPDGSRPGIFYIPILNASTFNTTSGMESLFLHEAIPGHHYQISLQQENDSLPKFRRFAWYGAYGEGWALYCESLGKELGLYTDPYQHTGALGDEIHRAIRLVVDVGIHHKGWSREQAIKYMMENEAISEDGAIAEIERYMAIPAQALSYKLGAMKIRELRNKYQRQQGSSFNLSAFHDAFLKDGCMPLDVVEKKMDEWAR